MSEKYRSLFDASKEVGVEINVEKPSMKVYPKVPGLAAGTKNSKWYSFLPWVP
jgi:hypothetical protein